MNLQYTFDSSGVGGKGHQRGGSLVLDRVRLGVQELKDATNVLALNYSDPAGSKSVPYSTSVGLNIDVATQDPVNP
jgi:hypothetical protein